MRWLLGGLGAVIALAALVVTVGLVVPLEGVACGRAVFRQSPEVLWKRLADFERWPEWNSSVLRVERGSDRDGKPVWNAQGGRGAMVIEVFQPPRLLVARIPEDAGLGFTGSRTYEIRPEGDGAASVTITERARVRNPLRRFFTIFHDDRAALESFLRELGTSFSEEVVPAAIETTG